MSTDDSATELQESSRPLGSGSNEAEDFECNICFDLATGPIITLCGHLYCWSCLCRWLRIHSRSKVCPVCKAQIEEEKLIPLYGRGKTPTDPRSKPVPGIEIPDQPAGNRPDTAPNPVASNMSNFVSGFAGGFVQPFGNFGMSAAFGGAFSPIFSIQVHRFRDASGYDATRRYHRGFSQPFHSSIGSGSVDGETNDSEEAVGTLKRIHFVVFILALFALFVL